jgi:hypothetical protein
MGKFKKGLNVTWKVMLSVVCLIAVIIGVCVLNAFYEHSTRKYCYRSLSNDVEVWVARNADKYFVYNEKLGEFTLKNLDWVSSRPDNDSLTVFCKDNKRGYLNVNTGEMVIKPEYDHAWIFSEGLAAVVKDDKVGFINKDNEFVIPYKFDYGYRMFDVDILFEGGLSIMIDDRGACGLIDKSGNWVIEPKYDEIHSGWRNKYRVVRDNGKYGLLSDSTFTLPLEYDYIEYAENGVVAVKDGWMKLYDFDGNVLQDFLTADGFYVLKYTKEVEYYKGDYGMESYNVEVLSDYASFRVSGTYGWGVIRLSDNKVIIPALYGSISMITEDRFEVYDSSSSSYLLFDLEGNIIGDL